MAIQGPGASFISSLGILGVVGMGAYLIETDPPLLQGSFRVFIICDMFYEPIRQLVGINNLIAARLTQEKHEILDALLRLPMILHRSFHTKYAIKFSSSFLFRQKLIVNNLSLFTGGSTNI